MAALIHILHQAVTLFLVAYITVVNRDPVFYSCFFACMRKWENEDKTKKVIIDETLGSTFFNRSFLDLLFSVHFLCSLVKSACFKNLNIFIFLSLLLCKITNFLTFTTKHSDLMQLLFCFQ